jgi:hypothetical protein
MIAPATPVVAPPVVVMVIAVVVAAQPEDVRDLHTCSLPNFPGNSFSSSRKLTVSSQQQRNVVPNNGAKNWTKQTLGSLAIRVLLASNPPLTFSYTSVN